MRSGSRGVGILIVLLLAGSIIGGWLGAYLGRAFPAVHLLQQTEALGLTPPTTLDLGVLTFTIGFGLRLNIMSLVGMAAGYLVYKRY
ncbi:MAG: DUF4321 domain-containing protein [Firmicutes bacterium]|nr:DUF4321 domain-containing protein [Bacillota bacterium]